MKWYKNMKSSVAADKSDSGVNRFGTKSKKIKPSSGGAAGPQAEKFNVASNSMYLGLWSVGGM